MVDRVVRIDQHLAGAARVEHYCFGWGTHGPESSRNCNGESPFHELLRMSCMLAENS